MNGTRIILTISAILISVSKYVVFWSVVWKGIQYLKALKASTTTWLQSTSENTNQQQKPIRFDANKEKILYKHYFTFLFVELSKSTCIMPTVSKLVHKIKTFKYMS